MFFQSFFDRKLAQYSYLVGCQRTGEAIVIDPARDIRPYVEVAKREGLTVTAATETHIHADFLSGARELADKLGVKLFLSDEGPTDWKYQFDQAYHAELVKEGSTFWIGNVRFDVLHTPGHTPESISFVLTDIGGGSTVPMGIFTGDFVFVGDIGRPDLLEKAAGVSGTADSGALEMFQSLKKFKDLPDFLQVWPAHGAGSACGKSLGSVPLTTVGYEKFNNWALKLEDEKAFVKELLQGQPEPPTYFATMKKWNKTGPAVLVDKEITEIKSIGELASLLTDKDTVVVDTRTPKLFAKEHIKGSYNITFNKSFVNWAGWILSYTSKIVLVTDHHEDVVNALQSIGLDNVIAYANTAILQQVTDTGSYEEVTVQEVKDTRDHFLLDVRNDSEWSGGHIEGATHIMLGTLINRLEEVPKDKKIIVQCQSGARSAIGVSILQAAGYKDVVNMQGGFQEWLQADYPVTIK